MRGKNFFGYEKLLDYQAFEMIYGGFEKAYAELYSAYKKCGKSTETMLQVLNSGMVKSPKQFQEIKRAVEKNKRVMKEMERRMKILEERMERMDIFSYVEKEGMLMDKECVSNLPDFYLLFSFGLGEDDVKMELDGERKHAVEGAIKEWYVRNVLENVFSATKAYLNSFIEHKEKTNDDFINTLRNDFGLGSGDIDDVVNVNVSDEEIAKFVVKYVENLPVYAITSGIEENGKADLKKRRLKAPPSLYKTAYSAVLEKVGKSLGELKREEREGIKGFVYELVDSVKVGIKRKKMLARANRKIIEKYGKAIIKDVQEIIEERGKSSEYLISEEEIASVVAKYFNGKVKPNIPGLGRDFIESIEGNVLNYVRFFDGSPFLKLISGELKNLGDKCIDSATNKKRFFDFAKSVVKSGNAMPYHEIYAVVSSLKSLEEKKLYVDFLLSLDDKHRSTEELKFINRGILFKLRGKGIEEALNELRSLLLQGKDRYEIYRECFYDTFCDPERARSIDEARRKGDDYLREAIDFASNGKREEAKRYFDYARKAYRSIGGKGGEILLREVEEAEKRYVST